jgi:hypothetical protein
MMRPFRRLVPALGFTLLAAGLANPGRLAAADKPRQILIDASHDGGAWWAPQRGDFSSGSPHQGKPLADHLRSLGFRVTELPRDTRITAALLGGADLVIRASGFGPYLPAEVDTYESWVKTGGRLLLLVEERPQDALAERFGLQFRGIARIPGPGPHNTTTRLGKFASDPLTQGVDALKYLGGSGLTAQPPEAKILGWLSTEDYLDLNDNNVKDPGEPVGPAALGILPFGQGRIVFCGDSNLWEAVPKRLIKNTLSYLTAP